MHARLDSKFTQFLLEVGDGTNQVDDAEDLQLPVDILINTSKTDDCLQGLIHIVFRNFSNENLQCNGFANKAILTTKNQFVDEINDILVSQFSGEVYEYLIYDETITSQDQAQYNDMLNNLTPKSLPPHRLLLKKLSYYPLAEFRPYLGPLQRHTSDLQ